jgi:ribonucleoside-diphosphate reductase alpha chain
MRSAYDFAEPGILFVDTINRENNLAYAGRSPKYQPCAEQPLPPMACWTSDRLILTNFRAPSLGFRRRSRVRLRRLLKTQSRSRLRALETLLDATFWPLPQQRRSRASKRRIGRRLHRPGQRASPAEAALRRARRPETARAHRPLHARRRLMPHRWILAQEKGRLPAVRRRQVPGGRHLRQPPGRAAEAADPQARHPQQPPAVHRPDGTVSLAFADNAFNGIEPPFSWTYRRKKREATAAPRNTTWRTTLAPVPSLGRRHRQLPPYSSPRWRCRQRTTWPMMEAVQPFIDTRSPRR